ncbi:MAG: hypothetical protein NTV62_02670 [Candidatus Gribaldobacteria bacterium]|nr:hypothetical protein [Candidatus Gribaldobacteria bacterium]
MLNKTNQELSTNSKPKAWVLTVSMGYGHQRTAYPLKFLSPNQKVVNANNYEGMPPKDFRLWESSRKFYEFVSRFKKVPIIGEFLFYIFDKFQSIWTFYPKRDLSKPTISLKQNYLMIKKGWGRSLIKDLNHKNLPIVSTFFTPAFMAEEDKFDQEIFCVVCDTDIARTWAPLVPQKSLIKYFTPNQRTSERLMLYGVPEKNIFQTGYPLPKENIGEQMEIVKQDLKYRLLNLDPQGKYQENYSPLIKKYLGTLPEAPNHPLTITFAVGGAGAQLDIAVYLLESFKKELEKETIRFILSAGIKEEVKEKILKKISNAGLTEHLNKNIWLVFSKDINDYFCQFNEALRTTDILWTKPSELSFYTALGIPIVMAPIIGAQEEANRKWLSKIGSGIPQGNPKYAYQWLSDLINDGWFAEAAMQGFIEVEKMGTYNIEKIISKS